MREGRYINQKSDTYLYRFFVALHGHFSNHFIPDLTRLANLLTA